jgi:hypothetical protein
MLFDSLEIRIDLYHLFVHVVIWCSYVEQLAEDYVEELQRPNRRPFSAMDIALHLTVANQDDYVDLND